MTLRERALAVVAGAGYLLTGAWALLAPSSWVRDYPGFGRHWLTAQDAVSPHLVADTAAGFVAVGVALLAAAALGHRAAGQVAGLTLLAHALPHFLHHLARPDHDLPALDVVLGVWGLGIQAGLGLWLCASATRRPLGDT